MCDAALRGVKRPGRGVHNPPHLAPKLKKSRAIPLLSLLAFVESPGWPLPLPFTLKIPHNFPAEMQVSFHVRPSVRPAIIDIRRTHTPCATYRSNLGVALHPLSHRQQFTFAQRSRPVYNAPIVTIVTCAQRSFLDNSRAEFFPNRGVGAGRGWSVEGNESKISLNIILWFSVYQLSHNSQVSESHQYGGRPHRTGKKSLRNTGIRVEINWCP